MEKKKYNEISNENNRRKKKTTEASAQLFHEY